MTPVAVACQPAAAGWTCAVTVGDDRGATQHEVEVARPELQRLQPGASDPEALVRAAFAFLLAREPRESILRRFELPVIGRYFPEWEGEVARMLAG
ncbi:MAG TPA: hypothetical protein VFY43_04545 [Candidatus Limnocylindria bacterium]|nr:hypothetical protein [Candidatus Limnocylindria bacterium]